MSDRREEPFYRPLGMSLGLHLAIFAAMTVSWIWHTEQKTMAPPAMMKAALVYAPKSSMPPQIKTDTKKPEKPKPEPPKPEPPKPEPPKPEPPKPEPPKPEPPKPEPPKPEPVKQEPAKPEIKPTDKPSPVAAKPTEPPKPQESKKQPDKKQPDRKQPDKKAEPAKSDAKQADKKQSAVSAIEKEKMQKEADMAIQALLNDEDVTRTGELSDDELGRWVGLISSRIEDNWSRPPNARKDMKVLLEIELASNGQVMNVTIVESSGNRAFDLAAEAAVRKVERFDEVSQMKPDVFNKNFRKFRLLFNPEDLLI